MTLSRWWAGDKMDDEQKIPAAELCIFVEDRQAEEEIPRPWYENLAGERKQTYWDLKELDRQICYRFCQQVNQLKSYSSARKLAWEWSQVWWRRQLRNWEFWARARNYLSKIVLSKWPSKAAKHPNFWAEKAEKKSFGPPTMNAPGWMWDQYLRELETSEDDCLSQKDMNSGPEALEEEVERDPDPEFPKHYEPWVPSQKYLESDPVGSFHIPLEETYDLLGNTKNVPLQTFRLAPEAIEAWLGDLRK